MLVFCDPTAPATADIVAFHHAGTVERYDGTAGDIFTRVNAGTPGRTVIAHPLTTTNTGRCRSRWGAVSVMCLTLANASAIIDHHPSLRPAGRGYTRTFHHASQLSPGDLWRPDPDQDPHTVTEVHRTRDRKTGPTGSPSSTSTPGRSATGPTNSSPPPSPTRPRHQPCPEGADPMIAITHTPTDGTSVGIVPPSRGLSQTWALKACGKECCPAGRAIKVQTQTVSSATSRKTAAGN